MAGLVMLVLSGNVCSGNQTLNSHYMRDAKDGNQHVILASEKSLQYVT